MDIAAFHLQAEQFAKVRPPAFGEHVELQKVSRERERLNEMTREELERKMDEMPLEPSLRERVQSLFCRRKALQPNPPAPEPATNPRANQMSAFHNKKSINAKHASKKNNFSMEDIAVLDHVHVEKPSTPPLFLQEAAHLMSLLSAVALSTLRNDLEFAESPLATFEKSAPWPHVDPDAYSADVRKDWTKTSHRSFTVFRYLFGLTRTDADRTLYNAARPFRVVGGVSDAEVAMLQAARGPLAKVALCTMWLEEFISREHLAGSTGKIAPPIISRLYQFLSDGNLGYNQARKVAYIPFPFPHAQITSLFVLIVIVCIPILMLTFVTDPYFGATLNLLTVMCFAGLHEVARELENPFVNVPNDIPLNNFQAQFNEALMTMFSGWHPDAYWDIVQPKVDAISEGQSSSAARSKTLSEKSSSRRVTYGTIEKP
eukprot:CAMPEP_0116829674 /NCGR_PEP_ID=MMETSP0418-20121206/4345_1 /TAXON_ID=1158023 /ORGANISM="Astrosyne radiata, Strain 13vi08-1A" /LENGTH=429 /DNA_ID=CAMNT_0004458705 /DNA_START=126 /DNA_END=1415 /DNA_ORIENTATION=+